jgi:hypothetical protein
LVSAVSVHRGPAALDEDDVTPLAVVAADAIAGADDAEPGFGVEGEAGGVQGTPGR